MASPEQQPPKRRVRAAPASPDQALEALAKAGSITVPEKPSREFSQWRAPKVEEEVRRDVAASIAEGGELEAAEQVGEEIEKSSPGLGARAASEINELAGEMQRNPAKAAADKAAFDTAVSEGRAQKLPPDNYFVR